MNGHESNCWKADPSLKSFVFTLKNRQNVPARRFALKAEMKDKADPSQKSFVFTLKNPHNFAVRRFALRVEKKDVAIACLSNSGPVFGYFVSWPLIDSRGDIRVSDNCNANTNSATFDFGSIYTNDTGQNGTTFFTGSLNFRVKEIEVFEMTD
jgi:hypothetical protein